MRAHELPLRALGVAVLALLAADAYRQRDRLTRPPSDRGGALAASLATGFLLTASSPMTVVTFALALASGPSWGRGCGFRWACWWGRAGGGDAALAAGMAVFRARLEPHRARLGVASAVFLAACALVSAALALRAQVR